MNERPIEIIDSWSITGLGIAAELKHQDNGLSPGTMLTSRRTGRKWTVKSRLVYHHASDQRKSFSNETERMVHLSFKSITSLEKSKVNILDKEKQGIYEYQLEPIEHDTKPIAGEILDVT